MPKKKAAATTKPTKQTATQRSKTTGTVTRPLPPKLTPPRATNLIVRERLFDLLDRIQRGHRVVWVSAPGGAGKTSLATSYLVARKLPVLWYQVDAGDGDVASFFYYLGLATARAAPRYKQPLPALTPEYLADLPTFTRNFFRELYRRLPAATVVVLDNYQDAPEASLLHDVVQIAMAEVPGDIHLMVLSRIEPPAVLARLRLCDHAACLDWPTLQLTPEESASIGVARLGKKILSEDILASMHRRTHGWAAGLVLMLEQARTGVLDAKAVLSDQKLMFDYFAGEILNRNAPAVREFLLKTALLLKISVADARTLTGDDNASDILEDLTRRNFFTVRHTGTSGVTYEYHPLFQEFLKSYGQTTFDPTALAALHSEAGKLLIQGGAPEDAAMLFQQGHNWAELAGLVGTQAPAFIAQGRYRTVQAWIASLPEALREGDPWIQLWHGAAWQPFDLARARDLYERAYARFKATDDRAGLWLSWSGVVETYIFEWSCFTPLDHWIAEFYALMAQDKTPPTPELMGRAIVGIFTALMYRQPGHADLPKWVAQLEAMLHQVQDPVAITTIGMQLLTYYSFWTGDMARANALYTYVEPIAARSDLPPLAAIAWQVSQAVHGWMTAENERSVSAPRRGLEIARDSGVHLFDVMLRMQEMSGLLTAGRLEEATHSLAQARKALLPSRVMDASYILLMQAAISFGPEGARQAQINCEQSVSRARATGCPWALGQGLGWAIWASVRAGDYRAAEEYLREANALVPTLASELTAFVVQYEEWYLHFSKNEPQQTLTALRRTWALARKLGIQNWLSWPYPDTAQCCAQALAHDIETDYVRALVRKRGLLPPEDEEISDAWPFPVKLYTFGSFGVVVDDKSLPSTAKAQKRSFDLLKALVAFGGREVSEQKLCDALWPGAEADDARVSLKMTLHRLRGVVGHEAIVLRESKLSLDPRACWVDVWGFERAVSHLTKMGKTLHTDELARLGERLQSLYRGAFLSDDEQAFAIAARERLRGKWMQAITALAERFQYDGAQDLAIGWYERGIDVEPLAESFYRALMHIYKVLRRPAEGLGVYQRCKTNLLAQLQVSPSSETEELAQALRAAGS